MKKRFKILASVVVLVAILAAMRMALPFIIKDQVNKRIAELPDYSGEITDVDLALWRGAYTIENLRLLKASSGGQSEPFLLIDNIDLSIQWRALAQGAIVGEAIVSGVDLSLIEAEGKETSQTGEEIDWESQLERLVPFQLNHLQVVDSRVNFRVPGIDSGDALTVSDINGELLNLTNTAEDPSEAFSDFDFQGIALNAPLTLEGRLDPNQIPPVFDVDFTLSEVDLPAINPWLREFLGVDAHAGNFELYIEVAADNGEFEGYAKPVLTEVDIFRVDERSDSVLQSAWEGLVDLGTELFENQPEDQLAAEIPIRGSVADPEIGTFSAVVSVLRNAFVEALTSSLEQDVSLPLDDDSDQQE